jgi:hypothetical protein
MQSLLLPIITKLGNRNVWLVVWTLTERPDLLRNGRRPSARVRAAGATGLPPAAGDSKWTTCAKPATRKGRDWTWGIASYRRPGAPQSRIRGSPPGRAADAARPRGGRDGCQSRIHRRDGGLRCGPLGVFPFPPFIVWSRVKKVQGNVWLGTTAAVNRRGSRSPCHPRRPRYRQEEAFRRRRGWSRGRGGPGMRDGVARPAPRQQLPRS